MTRRRARILLALTTLVVLVGMAVVALPDHRDDTAAVGTSGPAAKERPGPDDVATFLPGDAPSTEEVDAATDPSTSTSTTGSDGSTHTSSTTSSTTARARTSPTKVAQGTSTTAAPKATGPHDLLGRIAFVYYPPDRTETTSNLWSMRPDGSDLREEVGCPPPASGPFVPDLSPDGTLVLMTCADEPDYTRDPFLRPYLVVKRVDGGGSWVIARDLPVLAPPRWSPDATTIALPVPPTWSSNGQDGIGLVLIDTDGSNRRYLSFDSQGITAVAWSPDGRRLALQGNSVWTYDLATGTLTAITHDAGYGRAIGWDPSGEWIYVIRGPYGEDDSIQRLHPDGSDRQTLVTGRWIDDETLQFTPDGRLLYRDRSNWVSANLDGSDPRVLLEWPTD